MVEYHRVLVVLPLGRERGVKVTQLFPEVGNLGLVLPAELSKWTTGKVRKGQTAIVL